MSKIAAQGRSSEHLNQPPPPPGGGERGHVGSPRQIREA